jgi:hypothetical protein
MDRLTRPDDLYEQALTRAWRGIPAAVEQHDAEHACAGAWCDHRMDAALAVIRQQFRPEHVPVMLDVCPYVWDWEDPNSSGTPRESAEGALLLDAELRLIDWSSTPGDDGDPPTFMLLDPAATWQGPQGAVR